MSKLRISLRHCDRLSSAALFMSMLVYLLHPALSLAQSPADTASNNAPPSAIVNGPPVSPLAVSLGLERANAILDEALRIGREHEMLPLTVVVLDHGGHMVALKREDGSGIIRVQVANAKAYGALGMGVSSRLMGQRLADRPVFSGSLSVVSDGQYVPVPGGVLIRDENGTVIGAIGISGDTSDRDEFAAINAVRAIGLYPEPLEPSSEWDGSHL